MTEVETDEAQSTTTSWWHSPRAWAQLVLFVALVAVTGYLLIGLIGDSDDKASPPATTTTTITPEAEVETAYRAFIDMVNRLTAAPNPADPEIAQRSTGEVRTTFEHSLADLQSKGSVFRGGPDDHQTVLSTTVDGKTATLSVCFVGQSGEYEASTGEELQPMQTVTSLITTTLVREHGEWKVSAENIKEGDQWQGVYDCGA